ncbi:hypothetical protein DPMN_084477 [Dreissena polymorpha]|uniref:Uncharacterized protein n=1 Tax=Dreissena polymorpha TaxID=45954 RepID=A0A9D3YAU1_DREPO|nr:hypothetical protein DPMN_084477 [Dreissena polymorpha]
MTTKLSKFVGRYDFSMEHNESTINMLENEPGKNASEKRACKRQKQRVTEIMESAMTGASSTTHKCKRERGGGEGGREGGKEREREIGRERGCRFPGSRGVQGQRENPGRQFEDSDD